MFFQYRGRQKINFPTSSNETQIIIEQSAFSTIYPAGLANLDTNEVPSNETR